MTLEERFWDKVALWDACWIWIGGKTASGYGSFSIRGRNTRAHHFLLDERPPPGLHCDHLCRNRACVRPSHIEIVTNKVNVLRGEGPAAINAAKTHCPKGHLYDYIDYQGRRRCRQCHRDESYKIYWGQRSRAAAAGSPVNVSA